MQSDELNVILSTDNNYAQHLGAAIYSLLENNSDFEKINVYIIENNVSKINADRISAICDSFQNSRLCWISYENWVKQLELNMLTKISISAYARLFTAEMVPLTVNRILYMDCDMIVCESLRELWNTDLQNCTIGAVQDYVNDNVKSPVNLSPGDKYFNSGLLLIDLEKWRKNRIGQKSIEFIDSKNGQVVHHDQGVLNAVLKNDWFRLPVKYNIMTIHYIFNMRKLKKYFSDNSCFYTQEEINQAKEKPFILHFTPSFTSRPWCKNCKHPLKRMYWESLEKTGWKSCEPQDDKSKWYVKMINWRFRNLLY